MKYFVTVLTLHFIGWWGYIILFVFNAYNKLPNKWYIVLPIFLIAMGWLLLWNEIAQRYRNKN